MPEPVKEDTLEERTMAQINGHLETQPLARCGKMRPLILLRDCSDGWQVQTSEVRKQHG